MDQVRPSSEVAADVAAALLPPWFQALKIVADQWWARQRARTEGTFRAIVEETGPEKLTAAVEGDPVVEAMLLDALESAARTGLEAKRRLLANVIAAAVLDDAKVDESLLFVQTLRELDAIHLRALERLVREEDTLKVLDPEQLRGHWHDADAMFAREPTPVQGALVRTGCTVPARTTLIVRPKASMVVTDFGRSLLAHIRECDGDGQVTGVDLER